MPQARPLAASPSGPPHVRQIQLAERVPHELRDGAEVLGHDAGAGLHDRALA